MLQVALERMCIAKHTNEVCKNFERDDATVARHKRKTAVNRACTESRVVVAERVVVVVVVVVVAKRRIYRERQTEADDEVCSTQRTQLRSTARCVALSLLTLVVRFYALLTRVVSSFFAQHSCPRSVRLAMHTS